MTPAAGVPRAAGGLIALIMLAGGVLVLIREGRIPAAHPDG